MITREGKIALIIAGSALLLIGLVPTGSRSAETPPAAQVAQPAQPAPKLTGKEVAALRHTRTIVEGFLKAPATAKFPRIWEEGVEVIDTGDGVYRVRSYVDSQNGFGAMIRTWYSCKVTTTNGESFHISDFQVN